MNRINQNEIIKLAFGLREKGIEFETISFEDCIQIKCKGWDALCNKYSDGHEDGLIEIMGLPQCEGDVIGFLTAEDVLEMLG